MIILLGSSIKGRGTKITLLSVKYFTRKTQIKNVESIRYFDFYRIDSLRKFEITSQLCQL
jgi:hypothetical protein